MARTKKNPMDSLRTKPVNNAELPADGVIMTGLMQGFMASHGWGNLEASARFVDAHMDLRITLNSDVAAGLPWVTAEDAASIREHIEAHASQPAPSPMKWV